MTVASRRSPLSTRLLAAVLATLIAATAAPAARSIGRLVSVVVMGRSAPAAAAAVSAEGGRVDALLPIIDGALARVPETELGDLSRAGIVVPDYALHVQSTSFEGSLAGPATQEVGAPAAWEAGSTGRGVTVAFVDTGVADVPDLRGRVVASADLSNELNFADSFGHGTFMAGLVAGDGASSSGRYVGVAPEASLMSIKVAGAEGSTSLGRVLMGVQLADSSAARFNVRVMLLALSSGSPLPPSIDPLSRALRRAWAHGIVVVVPAGNDGPAAGSVSAPGEDPVLLTAGSVDDRGTADLLDDMPSVFSGRGPTRWGMDKPDLAAPGEHLVSLRAAGSTIDGQNPGAVVDDAYFKGTGTSMSAALTAGSAALLVAARPDLSADQAKAVLMGTAHPIPAGDWSSVGAGIVNAGDAVALGDAPQGLPEIPALGPTPPPFTPPGLEVDWYGDAAIGYRWLARQWDARQWAARSWDARSWDARSWEARSWAARQWADQDWSARQWADEDFNARSWEARSWDARSWEARQWAARSWEARQWAARSWDARSWDARSWAGQDWLARQWTARSWDARSWDARSWDARSWDARSWEARSWDARSWEAREWAARQWDARSWD
jgi:serine protease AprX